MESYLEALETAARLEIPPPPETATRNAPVLAKLILPGHNVIEIWSVVEEEEPVTVDGERLSPATLLDLSNTLGGEHGLGRVDIVENRFVGMKSRGVYETPGGTILFAAQRGLEQLCLDREVMHLRDELVPRYAKLV
jgi:argininosuccinate synthase